MRTRSGQEASEDRGYGETGTGGKAKELEPGPEEEGGQQEVFAGEVQQLSFLRTHGPGYSSCHMWNGRRWKREKEGVSKGGHGQR